MMDVVADADAGDATIGAISIGAADITMTTAYVGKGDLDYSVSLTADAVNASDNATASIASVTIGAITIDGDIAGNGVTTYDANVFVGIDINAFANAHTDKQAKAELQDITIGDLDLSAGTDGELSADILIESSVYSNGNATVDRVTIGNIDMVSEMGAGDESVSLDIYVSANSYSSLGDAAVRTVSIGNINVSSTDDVYAQEVDVYVSAYVNVNGNGNATVDDVTIGTIDMTGYQGTDDSASMSVDVFAQAGLNGGDAIIKNIDVGDIFAEMSGTTDDIDVKVSFDIEASARADASISDVTLGNFDVLAQGSAEIDIEIVATDRNFEGTGVDAESRTVSDITIGNLYASSNFEDGQIDLSVSAYTNRAEAADVSVENVVIGNVEAESNVEDGNARLVVAAVAAPGSDTKAKVDDITIGNVSGAVLGATESYDGDIYTEEDVDVEVDVLAFGADAEISNITIGNLSGTVADSSNVHVSSYVLAVGGAEYGSGFGGSRTLASEFASVGSATITDVVLGDMSALATNATSVDMATVSFVAKALASADVDVNEVEDIASITGVTLGAISAMGLTTNTKITLNSIMENAGNAQLDAIIDDVNVGVVTIDAASSFGSHYMAAEFGAISTSTDASRGAAIVSNVTVDNIYTTANLTNGGEYDVSVSFAAFAEGTAYLENVSVGDMEMAVNNAIVSLNAVFMANIPYFGPGTNTLEYLSDEGDIVSASVGDFVISVGENAEDASALPFNGGINMLAADDIIDVNIDSFTITAGAGSTIDEHGINVMAGATFEPSMQENGLLDDVVIGDIELASTGEDADINSWVYLVAGERFIDADIGNVTLSADDFGSDVQHLITAQSINDLDALTVGAVTLNADKGAVDFSLNVDAGAALGRVDVAGVEINSTESGSATVTVQTLQYNDANDGTAIVDVGMVEISANGQDSHSALLVESNNGDSDNGRQINVATVEAAILIDVAGSHADAELFVRSVDALGNGYGIGEINLGDISIDLSNSADAGRGAVQLGGSGVEAWNQARAQVNIDVRATFTGTGDSITVGDITLTSLVDYDAGRMNSAKVVADVFLTGDLITIGDVTVVGGLYADSGVTGILGSGAVGDFNIVVQADSDLIDQDPGENTDFVQVGGDIIRVDDDLRYNFEYDQLNDVWFLEDVVFAGNDGAPLNQFSIVGEDNNFSLIGDLDEDGDIDDAIADITFDYATGTLSIDWDNVNIGDAATAEIDLTFGGEHGLFNDDDRVEISLEGGEVGSVVVDAQPLDLLDNFAVLGRSNEFSWLTVVSEDGGATIGEVDYSGYAALVEQGVVINLSGFNGAEFIYGAQGDTAIVGTSQANTIVGYAGDDYIEGGAGLDDMTGGTGSDVFAFESADLDTTIVAVTDIIRDFNDVGSNNDVILHIFGDATEGNTFTGASNYSNFETLLATADLVLDGAIKYFSGGLLGSNNVYLVTDDDGDGYTDVIELVNPTSFQMDGDILSSFA